MITLEEFDAAIMAEPEQDTVVEDEDTLQDVASQLDARMSELPDNQKEFFLDHLVPETLGMIGLILGEEAVDFFMPMTDMKKKLSIIDREEQSADIEDESLEASPEAEVTDTTTEQPIEPATIDVPENNFGI